MELVEPVGLWGVGGSLMQPVMEFVMWCFGGLAVLAPYASGIAERSEGPAAADPGASAAIVQEALPQGAVPQGAVPQALREVAQDPDRADPATAAKHAVVEALRADGVELDLDAGVVSIEVSVLTRFQALEYLLVGPRGQAHESLFGTEALPSSLNVALLSLGIEQGRNLRRVEEDGAEVKAAGGGEREQREASEAWRDRNVRVAPPDGPPVYVHAGWRVGDEVYFYRVEDLIADVQNGRAMPRQGFVYLGSKMLELAEGQPPVFAADHFNNLINLALFQEGHTLLTSRLRAAIADDIWYPNTWLLPLEEQRARLVIADRPLAWPPPSVLKLLPQAQLPEPKPEPNGDE